MPRPGAPKALVERPGGSVLAAAIIGAFLLTAVLPGGERPAPEARSLGLARMLVEYFEEMSVPKPLVPRRGDEFETHRRELRAKILRCIGLEPLPERPPLDPRETAPLDHPWCTVRRVYYQIWPGVYSSGLLFMPKELPEKPAPAMLCPHGHWSDGHANPVVQARCLVFARLGYVTFSPRQQHYEDLSIGISHQTVSVWSNMRAIDFLQSLAAVDATRIGACGESGGGLQTQMLCAVDPRVKAATIVGMTCDFREILFPHASHCACNHFPGIMRFTDGPEVSAAGLPLPVLYLTMDDWTRRFREDNFPAIRGLYAANGAVDRVACDYEPTEHTYDRSKREKTYRWMELWLRGRKAGSGDIESGDVHTFPSDVIQKLTLDLKGADSFSRVSSIYLETRRRAAPAISGREEWTSYRDRMARSLEELLGEEAKLARRNALPERLGVTEDGDLLAERIDCPSEGGIRVPCIALRRKDASGRLPVALIIGGSGKESLLLEKGSGSPAALAREGSLVVVADPRFVGELSSAALAARTGPELLKFRPSSMLSKAGDIVAQHRLAWERNAIVWGRPIPGMMATDIRGVLDCVSGRSDADMKKVKAIGRDAGETAVAVLLGAVLDPRISVVDVDLRGSSFLKGNLPAVPSVLLHGDVLQWAAALADREVTLRNVPPEAGDPAWLQRVFAALGNSEKLTLR